VPTSPQAWTKPRSELWAISRLAEAAEAISPLPDRILEGRDRRFGPTLGVGGRGQVMSEVALFGNPNRNTFSSAE